MFDIQKGTFGNLSLDGSDYDAHDGNTTLNAFRISGVGQDHWSESDLSSFAPTINTTGYTQFRIYFAPTGTPGPSIRWYSGGSANNEPQLIVRYQP